MFENYHGEHCARLGAGQSVFPRSRSVASNSWLLHSVSLLLFLIPYRCMTTLETMWVDDTLRNTLWNDFLADKQKEWNGLILPVCTFPRYSRADSRCLLFAQATVILSVNVGFLAIQSADLALINLSRSASAVSVLSVLASYFIGHILTPLRSELRRAGTTHPVKSHGEIPDSALITIVPPQVDVDRLLFLTRFKTDRLAIMYR